MDKRSIRIIGRFECCGINMVVVSTGKAAHVINANEYQHLWGQYHPGKWDNSVDWNAINNKFVEDQRARGKLVS